MHRSFRAFLCLLVLAGAALPALAHDDHAGATAGGFNADLLANFDDASKKLIDLAEAIPADKYGWSPSDEVRTVSESLMHVAIANYFLPTSLGVSPPEGVTPSPAMEKEITAKADVIAQLKKSFAHCREAAAGVPDSEAGEEVQFFRGPASKRTVMLVMISHAHEHLGQMIAYARSVGVTPPWSGGGDGS